MALKQRHRTAEMMTNDTKLGWSYDSNREKHWHWHSFLLNNAKQTGFRRGTYITPLRGRKKWQSEIRLCLQARNLVEQWNILHCGRQVTLKVYKLTVVTLFSVTLIDYYILLILFYFMEGKESVLPGYHSRYY